MASRHTRTASTASETLITDTVSSLQRCVFGNVFRSQRQLVRCAICTVVILFILYMLSSSDSPQKVVPDPRPKTAPAVRSISGEEAVTQYRATYFEEIAKRFAQKDMAAKANSFHPSNMLESDDENMEGVKRVDKAELETITRKVKEAAMIVSKCREVPGMSIVMVKGDSSRHLPLGLADMTTGRSVTKDTKFFLNSISKTFLGQLMGVLISESSRNITWHTPVADILGSDFELATEELTRGVTLCDILSHRTGLSSGNLAVRTTYPEGWTRSRLVKNLKHLPPSMPFRKSFLYSNMCGMLAAHIAEVIGGGPWEKLMFDKLLAPLGMYDTLPVTSLSQIERNQFSQFYVPVVGSLRQADLKILNQGPFAPVALLATTASDITKWLQFNLRQGSLPDGRQLIRREVWSDMWRKQADLSPMFLAGIDKSGNQWPVKDVSEGYGLFWFRNRYRGFTNFWHGGGLYSHYSLAWHFPEKNVALYAVVNGYSGDSRPFSVVESLAYYTADLLLGYQPWLNTATLCSFPNLSGDQNRSALTSARGHEAQEKKDKKASTNKENNVLSLHLLNKDAKARQEYAQGNAERTAAGNWKSQIVQHVAVGQRDSGMAAEEQALKQKTTVHKLSLYAYRGVYHSPLFGNFSVFVTQQTAENQQLECSMNALTGILHHSKDHTFGVELTRSLRFISKPSKSVPAKNAFEISFVESVGGGISAVDINSQWAVEVPIRFQKVR